MRFLGVKGLLGVLIGLFAMAILLLSNNKLLLYFVNLFSKEDYTSIIQFDKLENGNEKNKTIEDDKNEDSKPKD
jgi:hypothetical protein